MIVSYSWLNSFFKKPLPQPEKLSEILTMHAFEVESFERKKNDWILNIDVLPDRAGDALSHLGIARECAAILNLKMIYPVSKIKEEGLKIKDLLSVEVKDKNCKRYSTRIISNIKVGPSPKWIADKLINCGINPINNIVDATNYVMLELGQPLHAFDYDKIEKNKIIVKHAKPGEKILLLNNTECVLDKKVMVIADEKRSLAIAGIKGGKHAEVDNNTKIIVLESANFDPKAIGQTARRLNIRTDASARFEHNLDPNLTEIALDRVCSIIKDIAQGEIQTGMIDVYKEKVKPKKIKLEIDLVNKILGINISLNETANILNRLGIKVLSKNLLLEIPTFRQDLLIPENIIEEIGRINGYDKIPSLLPCSFLEPAQRNNELFYVNKIKDVFKELKYTEVYNYSFISEKEVKSFNLKAELINNPISSFFKYLRPSLIPQIIDNIEENLKTYKDVRIFEINKVFIPEEKKIKEKLTVAGGISLLDLSKLKGDLLCVLNNIGIKAIFKNLELKFEGEKLGEIKQIKNMLVFELYFDVLMEYANERKEYKEILCHPKAVRDISGIIDDEINELQVFEKIQDVLGPLVIGGEFKITDVYKGDLPQGKKSITVNIELQHPERTLNTQEINKIINDIIKNLSEKIGWEERK